MKSIKTNSLLLLVLFFLILSCKSHSNDDKLKQLLEQYLDFSKPSITFVLSDYDCSKCASSIYKWEEDITNKSLLFELRGLYYTTGSKRLNNMNNSKFVKKTEKQINWQIFHDSKLMDLIIRKSDDEKGPFAIKIEDYEIVYIVSMNSNKFTTLQ